jgi:hypothetical protein
MAKPLALHTFQLLRFTSCLDRDSANGFAVSREMIEVPCGAYSVYLFLRKATSCGCDAPELQAHTTPLIVA